MSNWISVEDSLPSMHHDVWVFNGVSVFDAWYVEFSKKWAFDYEDGRSNKVTHWQPMIQPEPPKENS